MPHIVLTEEQARVVARAVEPVDVRDEGGRTVGCLTPLTAADIEAVEQSKLALASGEAPIPGEQVQAHLRKLEEISQRESLNEARVLELLRRMRAGEEV